MSAFTIFVSTGLLIYWTSRIKTLLHGSDEEIRALLESDLSTGRRFLWELRSLRWPLQLTR
jgi:hypothetical protein